MMTHARIYRLSQRLADARQRASMNTHAPKLAGWRACSRRAE